MRCRMLQVFLPCRLSHKRCHKLQRVSLLCRLSRMRCHKQQERRQQH
jgi:hypothetical protein